MSGLAAVFHRNSRPIAPGLVSAMLDAVPYRGLDGASIQASGDITLGFAKTAVTVEDIHEQQPVVSERTGAVIVADARLDNRSELLAQLPESPSTSIGDAEIILRAYEAWGTDALPRLLGDFAFVLWDAAQQRVVCGRDTSGQRMLFYRLDQQTLTIASEIHQLFVDPTISVEPNEARIRDYLFLFKVHGNERDHASTFFDGIEAVPAGHVLVVDRERANLDRYWEIDTHRRIHYRSDAEYAAHFYELFSTVVGAHLRSAYPMGAFLSGGLDSSSIVCTAHELYRFGTVPHHGFSSFSLAYEGMDCDESYLIRDVQEKYGFDAQFIPYGGSMGLLQLNPTGFAEAPNVGVGDQNGVLMSAAMRSGIRSVLTGQMADAYVNGSRHVFDSLLRQGKFGALLRNLRTYHRLSDESLHSILLLYCVLPLTPMSIQRRARSTWITRLGQRNLNRLMPHWVAEPLRSEISQRLVALGVENERNRHYANPAQESDYRKLYPPDSARHPAPWPIEIRRPFADRRLHELLLAIPPEQKFVPHPESDLDYAGSKWIVRNAMRGVIPESIRARTTKTQFSQQFQHELITVWDDYEAAFGPAGRSESAQRGYINQAMFWDRLQTIRGGQPAPDLAFIMSVVTLESWLRLFTRPRQERISIPFHVGANGSSVNTERRAIPVGAD